jgi:hypothetical protein
MAFGKVVHPHAWDTMAGKVERKKSTSCAKDDPYGCWRHNSLQQKQLQQSCAVGTNAAGPTSGEFATRKASNVVFRQHPDGGGIVLSMNGRLWGRLPTCRNPAGFGRKTA